MSKIRITRLILLSAAFLHSGIASAQVSEQRLFEDTTSVVVFVTVEYFGSNNEPKCESGTGFIISRDGKIITTAHLLDDEFGSPYVNPKIRVSVGNRFNCSDYTGTVYPATEVSRSGLDAVLLNIQDDVAKFSFIGACLDSTVARGEPIFVVGFPLSQAMKVMRGTAGSDNGPRGLREIDMQVNDGLSGGPIFNSKGRLIGLYKGGLSQGESQSYMLPLESFWQLVDSVWLRDQCWAESLPRPDSAAEGWLPWPPSRPSPVVGKILTAGDNDIELLSAPSFEANSHGLFPEGKDAEVTSVVTSPSGTTWIFVQIIGAGVWSQ